MQICNLNLQGFRSFNEKKIVFSKNTTYIIGKNATGKTNILEAIFLLATGKSFHAAFEEEMIKNNGDLARIGSEIKNNSETIKLEIILTTGKIQAKRVARKLYQVNGVGRRWRDFAGRLKVVLFRPEDIEIILGTPSQRRNYLDHILEQVDWQYRVCNLTYKKALRNRNKLLDKIREGQAQRSQLIFWNQLLLKNGQVVSDKRERMLMFFNQFLSACNRLYRGSNRIEIIYDKSAISDERLEKYAEAEIALGSTLVGPQRDDLKFIAKPHRDLVAFGSRGEQRMAIFAMKLAELEFVTKATSERPVLLLDDIFSELDSDHRHEILKIIPNYQTILTGTDDLLVKSFHDKIDLVKL